MSSTGLLNCLSTTRLLGRGEEWLLWQRGSRGGIGLWRLNQVEDRLGQSAHENVEDARFEGGQMSSPEDVNSGDREGDGNKDTQDGEEVHPGG